MFQEYSKLLTSKVEVRDDMEAVMNKNTQIVCECKPDTRENFKVEL